MQQNLREFFCSATNNQTQSAEQPENFEISGVGRPENIWGPTSESIALDTREDT
jgi:hypothetical protein